MTHRAEVFPFDSSLNRGINTIVQFVVVESQLRLIINWAIGKTILPFN